MASLSGWPDGLERLAIGAVANANRADYAAEWWFVDTLLTERPQVEAVLQAQIVAVTAWTRIWRGARDPERLGLLSSDSTVALDATAGATGCAVTARATSAARATGATGSARAHGPASAHASPFALELTVQLVPWVAAMILRFAIADSLAEIDFGLAATHRGRHPERTDAHKSK
jgi:hypothetical protein